MSKRLKNIILILASATALSACQTAQNNIAPVNDNSASSLGAAINPDYKMGSVHDDSADKVKPAPSLKEAINNVPEGGEIKAPKEGEDRLRLPAMKDAALGYGAQSGLVYSSRQINGYLQSQATNLSKTYDFKKLMIKGPNDVMVLPPVISEAKDTWEQFDAGKTLRVADKVYDIISSSTFTPVAPLWQNYLLTAYKEAEIPPSPLLPRNAEEKAQWSQWVAEGWEKGKEQANEVFIANLRRMERDYSGMIRYKILLEQNMVSAPVVADGNLGTTGNGQNMRVNDKAMRITQDPSLIVNSNGWQASPTTTNSNGEPQGPAVQNTKVENEKPAVKPNVKPVVKPDKKKPKKPPVVKQEDNKKQSENVKDNESADNNRF